MQKVGTLPCQAFPTAVWMEQAGDDNFIFLSLPTGHCCLSLQLLLLALPTVLFYWIYMGSRPVAAMWCNLCCHRFSSVLSHKSHSRIVLLPGGWMSQLDRNKLTNVSEIQVSFKRSAHLCTTVQRKPLIKHFHCQYCFYCHF